MTPRGRRELLSSLVAHPAFAYFTILALQLRVMWGFWSGRDLTPGDGSWYYGMALDWATSLRGNILWSPLYTAFYGAILRITDHVLVASLTHRLLIVLAVAALILALARSLLAPAVAWLVAAWWVILPINFDTAYEVHLFAAIPPLAAALLLARRPTRASRAAAVALLLAAALLVRTEMALVAALFAVACLWYEGRQVRNLRSLSQMLRIARPYAIALVISALVASLFFARSKYDFYTLAGLARDKAAVNFCQIYAFNYQQRNPDWDQNPFSQCEPLLAATFGVPGLTFFDAARRNPVAIGQFLGWNARLIPSGLQLALFNEISGNSTPDYAPAKLDQIRPLILSILTVLLVGAGIAAIRRDRAYWWSWLRPRIWSLGLLTCSLMVGFMVMLLQRPRPSYIFVVTATIMIVIGLCVFALARRLNLMRQLATAVPLLAVVLIFFAPAYYAEGERPLYDAYRRIRPHADVLASGVAAVPTYGAELCNYLLVEKTCTAVEYWTGLRPQLGAGGNLHEVLATNSVSLLYADDGMLADPIAAPFFRSSGPVGWRVVARNQSGEKPWLLLRRAQ